MAMSENARFIQRVEDTVLLASAVLLATWAFTSRSEAWLPVLAVAIAACLVILIRRLRGWIRATREPPEG